MSRENELSVIGAVLLDSQAYWRIADLIDASDFEQADTRAMWCTIAELASSGVDVDAVTYADRDPANATLAMDCAANVPGSSNVRVYAEIVQRDAINRRVMLAGKRIATLRAPNAFAQAQQWIAECAPRMVGSIRKAKDVLADSVKRMAERCELDSDLTGVPTSIAWLDTMLSGWQKDDLIILAARPSVGKTAMAVQAALYAAQQNHGVLFLSLEMSGSQLTDRMLSRLARVDMQKIRQPKQISEEEWPRITQAGECIKDLPMLIDDTGGITIDQLEARIRQAASMQVLKLVVIDYLTQITPPKAHSTTDAIQMVTRRLKALAKAIHVPILLLSQLNRAGDTRPSLTTLRDSGAIEQDADVVMFLHRPDTENRTLIECIIGKQRNGPIGECYLHFNGAIQQFLPTDERPASQAKNVIKFAKEQA